MKQNEQSLKTAEFSVAKKLSVYGTTAPRYFFTRSGLSRTASEKEQKIILKKHFIGIKKLQKMVMNLQ